MALVHFVHVPVTDTATWIALSATSACLHRHRRHPHAAARIVVAHASNRGATSAPLRSGAFVVTDAPMRCPTFGGGGWWVAV
jgi:hypothetical protein